MTYILNLDYSLLLKWRGKFVHDTTSDATALTRLSTSSLLYLPLDSFPTSSTRSVSPHFSYKPTSEPACAIRNVPYHLLQPPCVRLPMARHCHALCPWPGLLKLSTFANFTFKEGAEWFFGKIFSSQATVCRCRSRPNRYALPRAHSRWPVRSKSCAAHLQGAQRRTMGAWAPSKRRWHRVRVLCYVTWSKLANSRIKGDVISVTNYDVNYLLTF